MTILSVDKNSPAAVTAPTLSPDAPPQPEPAAPVSTRAKCGKIALLITEDWFALSHFRPLISLLTEIAASVVVVTRSSGRLREIEALGARTLEFDFRRGSKIRPGGAGGL